MGTITVKMKDLNLPMDTVQKLAVMAARKGRTLEAFIKAILTREADTLREDFTNPSPNDDPWFLDPANLAEVDKGLEDIRAGRVFHKLPGETLDEFLERTEDKAACI